MNNKNNIVADKAMEKQELVRQSSFSVQTIFRKFLESSGKLTFFPPKEGNSSTGIRPLKDILLKAPGNNATDNRNRSSGGAANKPSSVTVTTESTMSTLSGSYPSTVSSLSIVLAAVQKKPFWRRVIDMLFEGRRNSSVAERSSDRSSDRITESSSDSITTVTPVHSIQEIVVERKTGHDTPSVTSSLTSCSGSTYSPRLTNTNLPTASYVIISTVKVEEFGRKKNDDATCEASLESVAIETSLISY